MTGFALFFFFSNKIICMLSRRWRAENQEDHDYLKIGIYSRGYSRSPTLACFSLYFLGKKRKLLTVPSPLSICVPLRLPNLLRYWNTNCVGVLKFIIRRHLKTGVVQFSIEPPVPVPLSLFFNLKEPSVLFQGFSNFWYNLWSGSRPGSSGWSEPAATSSGWGRSSHFGMNPKHILFPCPRFF